MEVRDAVRIAKEYVTTVFDVEQVRNLGLEEVVFEEEGRVWAITVGFSRPWEQAIAGRDLFREIVERPAPRTYKAVRVRDNDGHVVSMTDRFLVDAR